MSRFIDPTTDFGFKKLFGEETNKDLIKSFLLDILELPAPLHGIDFANKEQLPEISEQRRSAYDLYCQDVEGNYFIVEMQKSRLAFIKDRMVYYSSFPIVGQAKKGKLFYSFLGRDHWRIRDAAVATYGGKEAMLSEWNYELQAVYCVAILGYVLNGSKKAISRNSLRDDEPPHEPFYEKLKFVTIELPLFDERKPEYSLDRHLNKWLYFLKYLPALDEIPATFSDDPIFKKAFRLAELANLSAPERQLYDVSLKHLRDNYAALTTSYEEGEKNGLIKGRTEGRIEGKIEQGQALLQMLFSQKLGQIPDDIMVMIHALNNVNQIHAIWARFMTINDWDALRRELST